MLFQQPDTCKPSAGAHHCSDAQEWLTSMERRHANSSKEKNLNNSKSMSCLQQHKESWTKVVVAGSWSRWN